MRTIASVTVAALAAVAAAPADAQGAKGMNWRAAPTYETVNLEAGFTPDPWSRRLQAGGPNAVGTDLGAGCAGYVNASAPDFDLNYEAGGLSLYFHVESDADTTLVVYGPDHTWYCNDDADGLNPIVAISNPPSGNYNVWVGVHGSSQMRPATLNISELNPLGMQASAGGSGGQQPNWMANPTFTTVNLSAGFTPDPWTYSIQAGGTDEIGPSLGTGCRGFIHAGAPDVDLNYTAGSMSLHIQVESQTDTTLAVLDPQGNWHCDDDTLGHNPVVSFPRPTSGNYNIWVGVYGSGRTAPAQVKVTEFSPGR